MALRVANQGALHGSAPQPQPKGLDAPTGPSVDGLGVDLRRLNVRMAEQLLKINDGRAALEVVRAEGVPQGVRRDP